jgi:hypothetical protein
VVQISLALSYGFAIVISLIFDSGNLPSQALIVVNLCLLVLAVAFASSKILFGATSGNSGLNERFKLSYSWPSFSNLVTQIVIAMLVIAVASWIGPYSEVPADLWVHLENIRQERTYLERGSVLGTNVWYTLQARLWIASGAEFDKYFFWTYLFNTVLFLGSIYSVATSFMLNEGYDKTKARWIGYITVIFVILFFGVGPFSYVRYYVYAPGFFIYPIYLLVVGIISRQTKLKTNLKETIARIFLIAICFAVSFTVHKQEALFELLALVLILVYLLVELIQKLMAWKVKFWRDKFLGKGITQWSLVVVVMIVGSLIMLIMATEETGTSLTTLHRDIYDLGEWGTFLRGLYVLKPHGQIGDVIGIFGSLVIVSAIVTAGYARVPYQLSCCVLAVPMMVFNPAFTSMFLNISSQEVLWRLVYMAPIPMIGAIVLVNNTYKCIEKGRIYRRQFLVIVMTSVVMVLSAASSNKLGWIKWQKHETLRPTPHRNSYEVWGDLISYLNTIETPRNILSDPITGYVLASTTPHFHERWKFHKIDYIEFNKPGYSTRSFEDYKEWLVVINTRNGADSRVGKISNHWPEEILRVSNHYSEEFVQFVNSSKRFKNMWSNNGIVVYEIQ